MELKIEEVLFALQKEKVVRVIIDGRERDFDNIDEALEFIKTKWNDTSFCNIRMFYYKNLITENGIGLNREVRERKDGDN